VAGNLKVSDYLHVTMRVAIDKRYGEIDNKYWTEAGDGLRLGTIVRMRWPMERTSTDLRASGKHGSNGAEQVAGAHPSDPLFRKSPRRSIEVETLLTAEDVAKRLNVSTDWVWDHSSRKRPLLPVIRMGDGALRYRPSGIEAFIDERERISAMRRRAS
jgi:predicted DNA-binding transcriptional regulator AlpA